MPPDPYREGYEFNGWWTGETDGERIYTTRTLFASENVEDKRLYAHWRANSYSLTFSNGTGYTITVKRTSSPSGKQTGTLSSDEKIYYGDVLAVTYTASNGYIIASQGETSITVTGNVGSDKIYATATASNRTFNVTYKSTNGTNLGNTTVTVPYGETKTISPPAKTGYTTPAAKTVNGSDSNTNIVFEYTPKNPTKTSKTVQFDFPEDSDNIPNETYYYVVEYRNRTSNSVEVRVTLKHTIKKGSYNTFRYDVSITDVSNSSNSAQATVVPAKTWDNTTGVTHDDSRTKSTGWITITGLSATQTTVPVIVKYWVHDMGDANVRINDSVNANIPAY